MADVHAITAILGLKTEARSTIELLPLVRRGLPYRTIESVAREMDLSIDETADRLGLARRTLARRKTLRTLDANESERVVRLADALTHAIDVLGSREKARRWLREPNRALGGASPMSLLDTGLGAQAVDELLVRIDHGVFS